jgi:hypothetical protein
MKNVKFLFLAASAVLLTVGLYSCKAAKDAKDNIASAQDFTSAETEFAGSFDLSDDINQSDGRVKKGGTAILPSGAVVTFVDTSFTDGDGIEYSIDFGPLGTTAPKGMLCGDGKYRAGVIHITASMRYALVGCQVAVSTTSADNFYGGDGTNMFKIEGTVSVTRTAAEVLQIVITSGKLTDPDSKTFTFAGTKTITRTSGTGTPGMWGDVYQVEGSGSGVNREGDSYTWDITTPLIKKMELGCAKTFVKGIIEIKNTTANTSLKVNFDPYNNEACDRIAKAIIGTKEFIFTVK